MAGVVTSVLAAVVVATQLPIALDRDDRAREVTTLQRQIAIVRSQIADVGSETTSSNGNLAKQQSANHDLMDRITTQRKRIAQQEKKVGDLGA